MQTDLSYIFSPGHFPVPDEAFVGSSHAKQNSYLKEKKQYFLLASNMSTHGPGPQIHISPSIRFQCSHSPVEGLTQQ